MSRETRHLSISLLLSLAIVVTASLSGRLYHEHRETQIAEARASIESALACR